VKQQTGLPMTRLWAAALQLLAVAGLLVGYYGIGPLLAWAVGS